MASPKRIRRIESFQIDESDPSSYFIGMLDGKLAKIPNNYARQKEDPIEIKTYTRDIDDEES